MYREHTDKFHTVSLETELQGCEGTTKGQVEPDCVAIKQRLLPYPWRLDLELANPIQMLFCHHPFNTNKAIVAETYIVSAMCQHLCVSTHLMKSSQQS